MAEGNVNSSHYTGKKAAAAAFFHPVGSCIRARRFDLRYSSAPARADTDAGESKRNNNYTIMRKL